MIFHCRCLSSLDTMSVFGIVLYHLTGFDITLFDILKITIPATLIGVLVGAFATKIVFMETVKNLMVCKKAAFQYIICKALM